MSEKYIAAHPVQERTAEVYLVPHPENQGAGDGARQKDARHARPPQQDPLHARGAACASLHPSYLRNANVLLQSRRCWARSSPCSRAAPPRWPRSRASCRRTRAGASRRCGATRCATRCLRPRWSGSSRRAPCSRCRRCATSSGVRAPLRVPPARGSLYGSPGRVERSRRARG